MTGSKLHVRRQQVGIRLRERTTPLPLHMLHSDGHQSRIPTAARDDGHGISNNAVSPSPHANQSKDVSFLMLSIRMPIPDWLTVSPQCIADCLHFTCDEYGFLRTRFDERIRDSRYSCLLPDWPSSPKDGNDKSGISKPKPDAGVVPWEFSSPASGNRFTEVAGVAVSAWSSV